MCERISDIKRIDGNREHELTIDVIPFEKAHMPPYDLYRITFIDIPNGITTKKVTRTESNHLKNLKSIV